MDLWHASSLFHSEPRSYVHKVKAFYSQPVTWKSLFRFILLSHVNNTALFAINIILQGQRFSFGIDRGSAVQEQKRFTQKTTRRVHLVHKLITTQYKWLIYYINMVFQFTRTDNTIKGLKTKTKDLS